MRNIIMTEILVNVPGGGSCSENSHCYVKTITDDFVTYGFYTVSNAVKSKHLL